MRDSDKPIRDHEPHVVLGTVEEFEIHGLRLPDALQRRKDLRPGDRVTLPVSAGLTLALGVLKHWSVPESDWAMILGATPESLVRYQGRQSTDAPPELQRIEDVLLIHIALTVLFPDDAAGQGWCTQPNKFFGGRAPAEVMTTEGTTAVRRYLEGVLQS